MKIPVSVLALILIFSCTAYAAISTLSKKEINPKNELSNYTETISENKENSINTEFEDIPIYLEDELLFGTDGQFYLSRDACFYEGQNACQNSLRGILRTYPTGAIRERDENTIYLVYDTDTGYRLFLFSSYDNNLLSTIGFPVVVYKELKYEDFKSLKSGDTIEEVSKIDPVAGLIKREILEVWNLNTVGADTHAREGYPVTSIHYLMDGILKIEYDMNDDRSLVISKIIYNENYDLISVNGKTINYRIHEIDLPYHKVLIDD